MNPSISFVSLAPTVQKLCSVMVKLGPIVLEHGPYGFDVLEPTMLGVLKVVKVTPRVKTLPVPELNQRVPHPLRLMVRRWVLKSTSKLPTPG